MAHNPIEVDVICAIQISPALKLTAPQRNSSKRPLTGPVPKATS
jgi:hypothetical protein